MNGLRERFSVALGIGLLLVASIAAGCGSKETAPKTGEQQTTKSTTQATQTAPQPKNPDIILATTTSTQDSGLLDVLVPMFEKQTGYKLKTIAVGTGAALAMGQKGEADVLLVHAPADELKVVQEGAAIERKLIMHNDFILVGPKDDPAKIKGIKTAAEAFKQLATAKSPFISRGDNSGTHKMELSLWTAAGVKAEGAWYQQSGSGMGQTLNIASEKKGYTLTDRATYLANQKNLDLAIVLEGDAPLLNIYHVMVVNPEKFSKVNVEGARAFSAFLLSKEGQETVGKFGVDKYGQNLFFADGGKTDEQLIGK